MTCVQGTSASKLDSSLQSSPVHAQLQAANPGSDDAAAPAILWTALVQVLTCKMHPALPEHLTTSCISLDMSDCAYA